MNRQERKAKRAAERQAALYKTTGPLTLDDAFRVKAPAVAVMDKPRKRARGRIAAQLVAGWVKAHKGTK